MIRLDTYIKQVMAEGKYTVGIFFDLEKAHDKTWRYGILKDLLRLGLRCGLPVYVREFMRESKFQVTVNGER